MIRTHYSQEPIETLRDIPQEPGMKPKGLWYSVDGDWERWCESEMPEWIERKVLYEVDLQQANILRITNAQELRTFHRRMAVSIEPRLSFRHITWDAVAGSGYDGIEIAPYIWECRLDRNMLWYYGVDCASGCIWNASKVRLRQQENGRRG